MANKFSKNLNGINERSEKESCIEKSEKHIVQNPLDRVGNSRAQFEDLPEEDPEEELREQPEEDPEEELCEDLEEDPEEESAEEDPEEESVEEDPEEEVQEESAKEQEEDPEEELCEDLEEDPEEELCEDLEEDPEEELAEELEEDPEEESAEEDPGEESVEEDVQEESAKELKENPEEKESAEELEEDPEEEPTEELEEDPEEEPTEEQEEDPEEEPTEELEEDPEEDPVVNIKWKGALYNEVPSSSKASYQSQKKCKQDEMQSQNLEPEASRLELSNDESISVATTDKVGSKEEVSGRFAKQRHSRWEPQPCGDGTNDDQTCKRRKTRWSSEETQMKMLGPLQLPNLTVNFATTSDKNPQIEGLKVELLEITEKSKPPKLFKKLYIPVKEYPEYNFIGLIIGPRGNTQKKMEKESGATILLRGKGSTTKASSKCDSEKEDLHVLIEADNQKSLDAAVGMVEKLLVPVEEGRNEHKREQLKELAQLKATRRDENVCSVCGDKGHRHYACPNLESTFKFDLFDTGFSSSLSTGSSLNSSMQNGQTRRGREINHKVLYVGYLPQSIDDNRLTELFSPFGKITEANIVKDRTTGISKGYGFVKFEDSQDAALAITHLNGFKIEGKFLKVKIAGVQQIMEPQV